MCGLLLGGLSIPVKVASRKLNEIMLALKIEAALSKDRIFKLYMNQVLKERGHYKDAVIIFFTQDPGLQ
jgi:membrane carboxypeptidase/penicillin-binding protein